MANMNPTMMTKKAEPGLEADKLIVRRCAKCGTRWVEPLEESACICKKAPAKKATDKAE